MGKQYSHITLSLGVLPGEVLLKYTLGMQEAVEALVDPGSRLRCRTLVAEWKPFLLWAEIKYPFFCHI